MDVELMVVADCPNEQRAHELLRGSLDDLGLAATPIRTVVVSTPEQAERLDFQGSPTILVDGVDPFAAWGQPGLTCRRYPHPDGPQGVPDLAALSAAIARAAKTGAGPSGAGAVVSSSEPTGRRNEAEQPAIDITAGR